MKTYYRGEGFGIVSLPEFDGPVVALESWLVEELGRTWHAANSRLATTTAGHGYEAVRGLVEVLAPLFRHFGEAVIQHSAESGKADGLRDIEAKLEEMRKLLEDFDPDNWPGGGAPKRA